MKTRMAKELTGNLARLLLLCLLLAGFKKFPEMGSLEVAAGELPAQWASAPALACLPVAEQLPEATPTGIAIYWHTRLFGQPQNLSLGIYCHQKQPVLWLTWQLPPTREARQP